jgi:hypothetical protein
METHGTCQHCGVHRLLPGRGPDGQHWCTDCAGGLGNFTCSRCGREGWIEQRRVCGRCVLTDRVSELLDDGTGRIRPELQPLAELITTMTRPRSGILWLSRPAPQRVLHALAHGQVPLTHEGIHSLTPAKSSSYVRDLMVTAGILPPHDRFLFRFEQWWPGWLTTITDPDQHAILQSFLTWHTLRGLRAAAEQGPVGYSRIGRARSELRAAAWFLTHLDTTGTPLANFSQAGLDTLWAATSESQRQNLRPFLRWAIRTHRLPRLTLPPHPDRPSTLITQQQRLAIIRRIHHGQDMNLTDRVLALLVVLYAQPLNRITQLTLDDITTDNNGQLLITLGQPPTPVPPPFDAIIRDHLDARANQATAGNPDSRWLFPGRSAGQPLHPTSIRLRLSNLGIPNLPGRTRAIRELLRQAPPMIVAGMLNRSTTNAEALANEAGTTWKHYAAINRTPRRPPRLNP